MQLPSEAAPVWPVPVRIPWGLIHGEVFRVDRAGLESVPYGDWGSTPMLSYGLNMDPDQLRARCARWDGPGVVARLEGSWWGKLS